MVESNLEEIIREIGFLESRKKVAEDLSTMDKVRSSLVFSFIYRSRKAVETFGKFLSEMKNGRFPQMIAFSLQSLLRFCYRNEQQVLLGTSVAKKHFAIAIINDDHLLRPRVLNPVHNV